MLEKRFLESFRACTQVFQVQLRKDYSLNDLKADMALLYLKVGLKDIGVTFLMSDSQVADERFLVVVNDMLASGEIADLFADDEVDNVINAVRNEVKKLAMSLIALFHFTFGLLKNCKYRRLDCF